MPELQLNNNLSPTFNALEGHKKIDTPTFKKILEHFWVKDINLWNRKSVENLFLKDDLLAWLLKCSRLSNKQVWEINERVKIVFDEYIEKYNKPTVMQKISFLGLTAEEMNKLMSEGKIDRKALEEIWYEYASKVDNFMNTLDSIQWANSKFWEIDKKHVPQKTFSSITKWFLTTLKKGYSKLPSKKTMVMILATWIIGHSMISAQLNSWEYVKDNQKAKEKIERNQLGLVDQNKTLYVLKDLDLNLANKRDYEKFVNTIANKYDLSTNLKDLENEINFDKDYVNFIWSLWIISWNITNEGIEINSNEEKTFKLLYKRYILRGVEKDLLETSYLAELQKLETNVDDVQIIKFNEDTAFQIKKSGDKIYLAQLKYNK